MTCNAISETPYIYTFFFDGYTYHSRYRVMQNMCLHCYLLAMYSVVSPLNLFYNKFNVIYKIPILGKLFFISAVLAVYVYSYQSNNVNNYLSTTVTHLESTEIIYLALNNVFSFKIMTKTCQN